MLKNLKSYMFINALALGFGGLTTFSVSADEPLHAGYYGLMIGDVKVYAISDGTVDLPMHQLLHGMSEDEIRKQLSVSYLTSPVETSVNAYLIDTGEQQVLIDTGAATLFGPTLGRTLTHLQAAGYDAKDIDAVLITHMHPDHVGGLMNDNKMAFPNATIHAGQADADYWLSEQEMAAAGESNADFFKGAMASLNPYVEAEQFNSISRDGEVVAGISAVNTQGHTPGHHFFKIESNGETLVFWGDVMHAAAVQFEHPEITIAFDSDEDAARRQRREAYAEAAREGYLVAGAHLSFPGIGRIRLASEGYQWVPVNFTRD